MNKIICHLSYHGALDDRIYWKELVSLKEAGYTAVHICVSDKDAEYTTPEGVRIIEIQRKKIVANTWLNRLALLVFKRTGITKILYEKAAALTADIYHYHDLQINAIAEDLKNLPHKPRLIYDIHEVWWVVVKEQRKKGLLPALKGHLLSAAYKIWETKGAAWCDYLIATDEFTLQQFRKKLPGISSQIVFNYSYFMPKDDLGNSEKKFDFIYTGLLGEGRGICEIIQALALLAKQKPHVKTLLIGPFESAEFEKKVRQLIVALNLSGNIILHEPVPFTTIAQYYQQSRIGLGLFHKTPKYSTFIPIKLFEYMAFGLPVIFSSHGPSAEIIREAFCGLLVDYRNSHAICSAMLQLMTDDKLYEEQSKNGRLSVQQKFNWDKEKQKLLDIYEQLLQK